MQQGANLNRCEIEIQPSNTAGGWALLTPKALSTQWVVPKSATDWTVSSIVKRKNSQESGLGKRSGAEG